MGEATLVTSPNYREISVTLTFLPAVAAGRTNGRWRLDIPTDVTDDLSV